jgi:hypothetical protein
MLWKSEMQMFKNFKYLEIAIIFECFDMWNALKMVQMGLGEIFDCF